MSSKYSYSKIDTYKGCPFKYKLQYEDGNYAFNGSIATEFGTAVHEAEESIAKSIQANEPIDYATIKNNFINKTIALEVKYPEDYAADDGKSNRNYRDKAYGYLKSGIYRLENFIRANPTYKIIGIEQRFNFDYDENHSLNGAIDRVFYDTATDKYIIQDIKTYAVPMRNEDLVTPLQFVVYTLAAKQLWGCTEDQISCQYDLPLVEITQNGGTNGYVGRGIKKIESLFKGISEQDFTPKPSRLCHWCAYCKTNENSEDKYKYLCPYFMKWTREDKTFEKENAWVDLTTHPLILEAYHKKYNINLEANTDEQEST